MTELEVKLLQTLKDYADADYDADAAYAADAYVVAATAYAASGADVSEEFKAIVKAYNNAGTYKEGVAVIEKMLKELEIKLLQTLKDAANANAYAANPSAAAAYADADAAYAADAYLSAAAAYAGACVAADDAADGYPSGADGSEEFKAIVKAYNNAGTYEEGVAVLEKVLKEKGDE